MKRSILRSMGIKVVVFMVSLLISFRQIQSYQRFAAIF